MAENAGSGQAGTPPEDRRPRPQYGELAPEGWTWQPPQDDRVPAGPSSAPGSPAPAAAPAPSAAPPAATGRTADVPAWDRPVTLGLLVLGLLATFFAVSVLNSLPMAVQTLYTQQNLGTYRPDASVAGLITAGGITEGVVWLLTAAGSILLTIRGKRAFYLPLIGAVVSFVVIFVFMSIILTTDPTLLDFYSRP